MEHDVSIQLVVYALCSNLSIIHNDLYGFDKSPLHSNPFQTGWWTSSTVTCSMWLYRVMEIWGLHKEESVTNNLLSKQWQTGSRPKNPKVFTYPRTLLGFYFGDINSFQLIWASPGKLRLASAHHLGLYFIFMHWHGYPKILGYQWMLSKKKRASATLRLCVVLDTPVEKKHLVWKKAKRNRREINCYLWRRRQVY